MLMSIPVIAPIDVDLASPSRGGERLLAAGPLPQGADEHEPDYTVHELSPQALPAPDPAVLALDDIEQAVAISEYHDFEWWSTRLSTVRSALERAR